MKMKQFYLIQGSKGFYCEIGVQCSNVGVFERSFASCQFDSAGSAFIAVLAIRADT